MQLSHYISPNQTIICNTFQIEGMTSGIKSYNLPKIDNNIIEIDDYEISHLFKKDYVNGLIVYKQIWCIDE